jgi:hypothetical protein
MFHDSVGEGLIGFLAPHFRRAVFVHDVDFNPAAVEAERPDVVVCEIVERYLMRYPQDRLHPAGTAGEN